MSKEIINMLIVSIIVCIIIICMLVAKNYINTSVVEKFNNLDEIRDNELYGLYKLNDLGGVNQDSKNLDNEYYNITLNNNTYNRHNNMVTRPKELYANQFHTRQPGLVKQRYSYDDASINNKNKCLQNSIAGTANLNELYKVLKNVHRGKIDSEVSKTSLEYYPDISISNNSNNNSNNKIRCKSDPVYKTSIFRDIRGYTASDSLPAELADRVKSNEYKCTKNLLKERRDELLYLPMDNIGPV
jgi:hypothetical protein